jgi:P-type Ca2+ transporter type 2C
MTAETLVSIIDRGLTEADVLTRQKQSGFNELPSAQSRNLLSLAWNAIRDPIFLLLVGGGVIYWILGDLQEALILLGFVVFIMGISLYQEGKTEHALAALRDLSSPRALVVRDGQRKRIAGREVVRGDILILAEGDRVPADGIVLSCTNLSTNESLLTGESLPVRKIAAVGDVEMARPGGDELPFVFSGTLVVQGQGIVKVRSIGSQTEMGKIGNALQQVQSEVTPLQREMNRLVSRLLGIALSLCVAIVVIYGFTTGDWLKGVLAGITLAMAILPNEFPVVVTIFLALGAWRISQNHVLARRSSAVETLGSATVLCVDKTGTLTLNQMAVQQLLAYNHPENSQPYDLALHSQVPLPEAVHELVEFCILASQRDPFDPMEKAFKELGEYSLANTEHLHDDWQLLREYPLSPELLAMSHVWQSADNKQYEIATKGAPEAIADLCHFTPQQQQILATQVSEMAARGLRVLGVAKASLLEAPPPFLPPHPSLAKPLHGRIDIEHLPAQQHDYPFQFLGLVGLSDPVRPTVAAAVRECYTAGIRVVMITGDYPETARSIAHQVGLTQTGEIITGAELDRMSNTELQQHIQNTNIFARAVPEQKLRIVNALKDKGEVVAMTGDGVNDAPALKAAQIGIAMGQRGTDVARESAALVLLDDDFSSIVQAVKLGRRIFDNLRKAMSYLLAIHIPIAGMSLIPVLFKLPLVLLPIHVAFLHLIIDPACSIVLEAEPAEANVMQRPPRHPKEPLFGRKTVGLSILQGSGILVIILTIFLISLDRGQGELDARTLTFTTLILANLGLIISESSTSRLSLKILKSPNPTLWWTIGGGLFFLAIVLYIPLLRNLFSFSFLHSIDLVICLGGGIISLIWFEFLKLFDRSPRVIIR